MSSAREKKLRKEQEHDTNRISRQPDDTESHIGGFFTPADVNAWRRTSKQSRNFKRTQETLVLPWDFDASIQQNWKLLEHYNLSAVKRVKASGASVSTDLLYAICKGTEQNLLYLNLSDSQNFQRTQHRQWITDDVLETITALCPKLETLRLAHVCRSITDAGLIALSQRCPQLSYLNLSPDEEFMYSVKQITDRGVIALSQGCPQLSFLNLEYRNQITDASVIALAQGCPKLSSLNIKGCWKITDAGLIALSQRCPQLSYLNLSPSEKFKYTVYKQITDRGVIALSQGCPQLSFLNLEYRKQITDASVTELARRCSQLSSLNLKGCWKITDAGVIALSQRCPQLSYLNLSPTEEFMQSDLQITDRGVTALSQGCPQLSFLNLEYRNQITDASVTELARRCSQLSVVVVKYCSEVTEASVIALVQGCPNLSEIEVREVWDRSTPFFLTCFEEPDYIGPSTGIRGGSITHLDIIKLRRHIHDLNERRSEFGDSGEANAPFLPRSVLSHCVDESGFFRRPAS